MASAPRTDEMSKRVMECILLPPGAVMVDAGQIALVVSQQPKSPHLITKLDARLPRHLRAEGTRMRFLPWLQSRTAKQNEKRDALEVQGNGFNLSAIWSFLDGGAQNNESGEPVNDFTALFRRDCVLLLPRVGRGYRIIALPDQRTYIPETGFAASSPGPATCQRELAQNVTFQEVRSQLPISRFCVQVDWICIH
jgi:hypothetical protein